MALRTLVFSSDSSATQIVAQHLLEFDLEPIICHDIFSALENLGRNRFDGILVDWSDDPEASFLITRVKETELNRRATLLAIVRSQGEAARATEMGAKAVLFRPLTSGEIREVLTITRPFMFERAVAIESIPTSAQAEHASVKKTEQAAEDERAARGNAHGPAPVAQRSRGYGNDAAPRAEGTRIVGRVDQRHQLVVGARVGDEVTVEVPEAANVRAGVIVYVVPVAGLLLGYAAGALVGGAGGWNPDVLGAVGAVAAVSAGLLLLRRSGRSVLAGARYRPRVRAIIAPGLSPSPKAGSNENHPSEPV